MNQPLSQKIKELEKHAAKERQGAATWLEKLKHRHEVKTVKERDLHNQELNVLNVNHSCLQHEYKSLLQRHTLLLNAFTDKKSVTFEEYISAEADKVVKDQIKAVREETEDRMEALQSKIKKLLAENASAKKNNASLSNVISIKQGEIGKLEAHVNALTMDIDKASTKIKGLEIPKDALDRALCENMQSLSTSTKMLQEVQSQYNTEKKRLEDEVNGFKKQIEMLNEKLQKEEGERATLCMKVTSFENTNVSLKEAFPAKLKEIGKLEAHMNTLTIDTKKSSAKIKELETTKDALNKALKESTHSLSVKVMKLSEMQSQYNMEKKRLEDELCAFRKANEMLNKKLQKEEKEKEAKRREEEEIKRKKENQQKKGEERVKSSVQPWNILPGYSTLSSFIESRTNLDLIYEAYIKEKASSFDDGLDINKDNDLTMLREIKSILCLALQLIFFPSVLIIIYIINCDLF